MLQSHAAKTYQGRKEVFIDNGEISFKTKFKGILGINVSSLYLSLLSLKSQSSIDNVSSGSVSERRDDVVLFVSGQYVRGTQKL